MSCLFCKIIEGTIPSKPVYQDELVLRVSDINPKAPVHVLVVPREHIGSLARRAEDRRCWATSVGGGGDCAQKTWQRLQGRDTQARTAGRQWTICTCTCWVDGR